MFEIFEEIYVRSGWGDGSGPGSSPDSLAPYIGFLERFLKEKNPKTIVDLGCGFFAPYYQVKWGNTEYIGIDVAGQCIKDNLRYSRANLSFKHDDWCNMANLPEADLAICKDVLQHWSHRDILKGLRRLTKYRWVILTNSFKCGDGVVNCDIDSGNFRPLDLLIDPYLLRASEFQIYEVLANPERDIKMIILWEPAICPLNFNAKQSVI